MYQNYQGNRFLNYPQYQQPIYPQYQQSYPQQVQQPIQQQTYEIPIQSVKFVNSDEAKAYIVMPNTKELLIDKTNGMAYLKSADAMGQSSCKIFSYTENEKKDEPKKAEIDTSKFASNDELIKTNDAIKSLTEKVDNLQKQLVVPKPTQTTN